MITMPDTQILQEGQVIPLPQMNPENISAALASATAKLPEIFANARKADTSILATLTINNAIKQANEVLIGKDGQSGIVAQLKTTVAPGEHTKLIEKMTDRDAKRMQTAKAILVNFREEYFKALAPLEPKFAKAYMYHG